MVKVDETDVKILAHLSLDARASFREIAEKLDIAEGTVYNRVNKLREQGVIKKFTLDIDYSLIGYELTAVLGVIVKGGHLPEIEEKIASEENVVAVYDVTGEYDAIVIAKLRGRQELNSMVKRLTALEHVERTYTMVALNVVKEEHGIDLG